MVSKQDQDIRREFFHLCRIMDQVGIGSGCIECRFKRMKTVAEHSLRAFAGHDSNPEIVQGGFLEMKQVIKICLFQFGLQADADRLLFLEKI